MPAGEGTSFVGTYASIRTTYQTMTSQDAFSARVKFACFTKNPFMKAIGLEAFGVQAVQDLQAFGAAAGSPKSMISYQTGKTGIRALIQETAGNSFHVGRMDSHNPELIEGGDEYAYSHHQLVNMQYIPVNDVDDNTGGLVDIKALKMKIMKQTFVRDVNYCFLGHSSAPDAGVMGPSVVYHNLPNLISVDQTRTVGAIATTNSFWQNGSKAITTIGGGGEMDRPLMLRRGMKDALNDQLQHAEASNEFMLLGTQGAYQIYDRIMYADAVQSGRGGAFGTLQAYDAAGIPHFAFEGNPFIWDPAVQVPYASSAVTAGTECIYGIHKPSFEVSIRTEKNFKMSDWEPPRQHDQYKTLVATLDLRYTPMVTARRPHFVIYNIPAHGD